MQIAGKHFTVDWFLAGIIVAAVVATFLPAQGIGVPILEWGTRVAIFILFFLYGVRLKPQETLAGITHWRLHVVILSFTYLAFPLIGLALRLGVPHLFTPELYRGLLWICLLPSTVQSSINFTSIAKGNVAAAIVSASMSNLLGVFITPILAILLMSTTGLVIDPTSIIDISAQILLPFILGQLSRRWTAGWVAAHPKLKYVDQFSIILVVYKAFSSGARNDTWSSLGMSDIVITVVVTTIILAVMLVVTWKVAGALGFNREDQIAIQFCGTKKSLATGVPMASVMFPAASVGIIVLPLMIFHQIQLMACSALASHYARRAD